MQSRRCVASAFLLCMIIVLGIAQPAHAYIDPNAAGLVSQILTPLLVFAAAGVTFFRKRIASLFSAITRRDLRAEKRKAVAEYDEAGANYNQVVLQAFEQVADSLRAVEHDAQALQARNEAAEQAQLSFQIAARRYGAGGISQLSLLDAQRQYLQTSIDRTSSAAARFSDSAALLQALGGGWWNEPKSAPQNENTGSKSR